MTNTKTIKIPVELELEPPALYEHDEDGERYGVESTFEMHIIDRAAEKLIDRLGDQAVRELREVVRQRAVAIVDRRIQEEVEEIKEMIASELEKDIESIKAEATKRFRGAVDGVLVETIKGALKRELAL